MEQIILLLALIATLLIIRGQLLRNEILKLKRNKLRSPLDRYKLKYEKTGKVK